LFCVFQLPVFGENEPSDAETLDSDSSGDECGETDNVDSGTERTTESEEQVVPTSQKKSFSRESASENESASEVTAGDVFSTDAVINASSSSMELGEKIDLLLYSRLLKQAAAKSAKSAAKGVVHSDPVSAQLGKVERSSASVQSIVPQSLPATSCTGGLHSAVRSAENQLTNCFQKPTVVSRRRNSGISAVHGPQIKSSVQNFNVPPMTASTSAARHIAPTFCGSIGTSTSVANKPAFSAAVKVESPENVANQTYAVVASGGSPEHLHNETFCLQSVDGRHKTATQPSVSESVVISDVKKHHQLVDNDMPLDETFATGSLSRPMTNKKLTSVSVVPASQCDVALPTSDRLRQLSISSPSSPRQRTSLRLSRGDSTKASDAVTTSTGPSDARVQYNRNPMKQTDSTSRHMDCASSQKQPTALDLQQGVTTKSFLDRPVIAVSSSVSADTHDLRDVENPGCLKVSCLNHTTDISYSEPTLCKAAGSTEAVKAAGRLLPDLGTLTIGEPAVRAVVDTLQVSGGSATRDQQSETFTACTTGRCAATANDTFAVSGCERCQSHFVDLCNDTNNNCMECARSYDVGPENVTVDGRVHKKKSSRRRFRGFAASTPLRDCSPPHPDASFRSLSSVSVASDWESYDTSDESEGDVTLLDNADEVLLLDVSLISDESLNVAFVSDDQPGLLQSAASNDTVTITSHHEETGSTLSEKCSQLLMSPQAPEFRQARTNNGSASQLSRVPVSRDFVKTGCLEPSDEAGPVFRELRSRQTRPEVSSATSHITVKALSHKTNSEDTVCQKSDDNLYRKSCLLLSSTKSPNFPSVSTSSRSLSHLRRFVNSREPVKTRCYEPSSEAGPVVSHLRNKRTRQRLPSSSLSDEEDATFTKQNTRSLRNTRARLADDA